MTDARLLANRFDTRNMIGWLARATTDSKFGLPVVEIGFICIYNERPDPGTHQVVDRPKMCQHSKLERCILNSLQDQVT